MYVVLGSEVKGARDIHVVGIYNPTRARQFSLLRIQSMHNYENRVIIKKQPSPSCCHNAPAIHPALGGEFYTVLYAHQTRIVSKNRPVWGDFFVPYTRHI